MLHVEPNAGARIFYLQRRAEAMFGKDAGSNDEAESAEDSEAPATALCAPRTWGSPDPPDTQGSSCDSP